MHNSERLLCHFGAAAPDYIPHSGTSAEPWRPLIKELRGRPGNCSDIHSVTTQGNICPRQYSVCVCVRVCVCVCVLARVRVCLEHHLGE